jgi:hypothetical protein
MEAWLMPEAVAATVGFFKAAASFVGGASAAVAAGTATAAQVATVVAVNLAVAGTTSALSKALSPTAKSGRAPGAPNDWRADPDAPLPIGYGRFGSGGYIVFQKPHGDADKFLTTVSVLSIGPIQEIERQWFGTDVLVTTNPGTDGALPGASPFFDAIWTRWQLGATPEATALPVATRVAPLAEWTSAHKLSGFAACITSFDPSNTTKLPKGIQKLRWDCKYQKCYDPRLDSTYPGGSGTHRINDPSTWAWTENPFLCALHWTLGVTHNDVERVGIFAKPDQIRPDFVTGANIADDNGWGCGNLFTSSDSKWGVLSALLEAGGAVPVIQGGQIGCIVKHERIAVGTITPDQIISCQVTHGADSNGRVNTAIPKYNSEDHGWQVVAGTPVVVTSFLDADDGLPVTREMTFSAVTDPDQAAALCVHKLYDARPALTLSMECFPVCAQYQVGECVNVKWRSQDQTAVKCEIIKRTLRPESATVLLVLRAEDDTQYDLAAAATTTGPTVINFGISGDIQTPLAADWTLLADHAGGDRWIDITGAPSDVVGLTSIAIFYRETGDPDWIGVTSEPPSSFVNARQSGLTLGTSYDIGVQYFAGLRASAIVNVGSETA